MKSKPTYFAPMQGRRSSLRNPFSGRDELGFQRGKYHDPVWKKYIIDQITKVIPEGWTVQQMYYAPEFEPEPLVKLFLLTPASTVVEHEIRVPIDSHGRKWGGRVPEVLVEFVRLTYAS